MTVLLILLTSTPLGGTRHGSSAGLSGLRLSVSSFSACSVHKASTHWPSRSRLVLPAGLLSSLMRLKLLMVLSCTSVLANWRETTLPASVTGTPLSVGQCSMMASERAKRARMALLSSATSFALRRRLCRFRMSSRQALEGRSVGKPLSMACTIMA